MTKNIEKTQYMCKICGAEGNNKLHRVKEMFFGTRKEFLYFECEKCQCMQIATIPDDLSEFYGNGYYSFAVPKMPEVIAEQKIETRILDVGCGAGKWLIEKYGQGHVNLYGCDPFIEKDICYEPCIHIKKCTIHEMQGTFDLIRLGDSFEHMSDPYETLVSIRRLLSDEGMCLISMPVFPNAAFDIYGVNWYEWDAPRHLFLHSIKSMEYLCQKAGLRITDIQFNANYLQFVSSLLYQKGIPFMEQTNDVREGSFTPEELQKFTEYTDELNARGYGDHAVFAIMK